MCEQDNLQIPNLGYLLGSTFFGISSLLTKKLKEAQLDITAEQARVIKFIASHTKINQQFIANKLDKERPAVTKLIDGLQKKGLVQRIPDPNDRRNNLLELTPQGSALHLKIQPILVEIFTTASATISDTEFAVFEKVIRKIKLNIQNEIESKS